MVVERFGNDGAGFGEVGGVVVVRLVGLGAFGSTISTDFVDGGDGRASLRATSVVPEQAVRMTTTTAPMIDDGFRRREAGRGSSSIVPRAFGMLC